MKFDIKFKHILLLTTTFCWTISLINGESSKNSDPPEIIVLETNSNMTILNFQNETHVVVSKNISYVYIKCTASYPVMWSLNSLEKAWTDGTSSERIVGNFTDKSTYKYTMTVRLKNFAETSQMPEGFICHAADLSTELVSRVVVIWESKTWPHLNVVRNEYKNGSYQIYWKDAQPNSNTGTSTSILIPCYSLNVDETKVELYRKESNQNLTFLDHNSNPSNLRFEPYVGFFLNSTTIQNESEVYECHVTRVEATPASKANNTSKKTTFTNRLKNLTDELLDDFDWLEDLDYLYVEDLEDVMLENTTYDTIYTQHTTPGTKVPGSLAALIFTITKNSSIAINFEDLPIKITNITEDTLAYYLTNRTERGLVVSTSDSYTYHVTCCIKSGAYSNFTSDNMLLHYKKCTEPLMCLTRNHILKRTYVPYYSRDDSYLSPRCRSMSRTVLDDYNPNVYICHMRTDMKYSRSYYGGYFQATEENYETSYLLQEGNYSKFIQFEYQSTNDNHKKQQWTNAVSNTTFYIGDIVMFRCKASPFLYASGIYWEKEWKNNKREYIQSNTSTHTSATNSAIYSIELVDEDLVKISCHIPPWNSTDWVTYELPLTVKASSAPASPEGHTMVYENVTFYTRQSVNLQCNFDGHPPPKFKWNATSAVYTIDNKGTKSYPYEASANTTVSIGYTWNYIVNTTADIPAQEFSCTASNVAGNATKYFMVQAIRSYSPLISNAAREVVVLFLNDENSALDCSIKQGLPLPEFYWKKHGMNISTLDNYEAQISQNMSTLIFKQVRYEDEGEYTCLAANFVGVGTKEFSVRVRERPHPRFWYEFTLAVLSIALIILFATLAYVYITKTKKINRLEMRAEYTKALDKHESRITIATNLDD